MSFFTQWCDCMHSNQDARQKRHSNFELRGDQIGIFPVFKPSEKIVKIGLAV